MSSLPIRAILVQVQRKRATPSGDILELANLAQSGNIEPVKTIVAECARLDPKYLIGSGKVQAILAVLEMEQCQLVIFDHALSPSQIRNLETVLKVRILDRTDLIIDIFALRAKTFEGKLQVELARLQHLSTRLVRGWSHLERQKGGIGLRGPGETQLETDRRLISVKINQIEKQISKVRQQRAQNRRARKRACYPIVTLVGYTNAGKSTLFNALTQAHVYTASKPFATLDPTWRRLMLPNGQTVIVVDTVGFIKDLPHHLIDAFHATLEETKESDLLLHVLDAAEPDEKMITAQVNQVLSTIGAAQVPQLLVYNKCDLLTATKTFKDPDRIGCSAITEQGLMALKTSIAQKLFGTSIKRDVIIPPRYAKWRAWLHQKDVVIRETVDARGYWRLSVYLSSLDYQYLIKKLPNQPAGL